jgi:hypothetical protein
MNSTYSIKKAMCALYKRHSKGPTSSLTGLYDDLPIEVTQLLLNKYALQDNELPVIVSIYSNEEWIILTTLRVIFSCNNNIYVVNNQDISNVFVDADACIRERQADTYQLSYLWIKTFSGDKWTIHIQPGAGFVGIISVITKFVKNNWRTRKGEEKGDK